MSIIRPPLRLRPHRILIALAAITLAAALVPFTSSAERPTAHHLVFRLTGQARQDVVGAQAIAIAAHCPTEACAVVASAVSRSPAFQTAPVRARIAAGASERLALPLTSLQRGKLKAALEAGHSPTLTVHATAHDVAGIKVPLSLVVRPLKP